MRYHLEPLSIPLCCHDLCDQPAEQTIIMADDEGCHPAEAEHVCKEHAGGILLDFAQGRRYK